MKRKGIRQPQQVRFMVAVDPDLKRRLEEAARKDGLSRDSWIARAIEHRLVIREANAPAAQQVESSEYLQEQKLDDIRAMRETW